MECIWLRFKGELTAILNISYRAQESPQPGTNFEKPLQPSLLSREHSTTLFDNFETDESHMLQPKHPLPPPAQVPLPQWGSSPPAPQPSHSHTTLYFQTQPPKNCPMRALSAEDDHGQFLRPHSPERHSHRAAHLTSNAVPQLPPGRPLAPCPPSLPSPSNLHRFPSPNSCQSSPLHSRGWPLVLAKPPQRHSPASPLTGRPPVNAVLQLQPHCLESPRD